MSKKAIIALFIFVTLISKAQTDSTSVADTSDNYVETMPQFPGGEQAIFSYLAKNISYPAMAVENEIQGKVVIEFVVRNDGQVTDARVTKGIGFGCDEEALRVIKGMPRWMPGTQNGKPVNVTYRVPVLYKLDIESKSKKKSKKKR